MSDYSVFTTIPDFWTYWGFEPWEYMDMKGFSRKVTFVKDSIMGEIARYYAYDYIVLVHRGNVDADIVYRNWKPGPDVMLQRFLFLEERAIDKKKIKSFCMGFRGFLEIYRYSVNTSYDKKIKDLAPLVDKAWELIQKQKTDVYGGDSGTH